MLNMWSWPKTSREGKSTPVRILILDQGGILRASGRSTLSPVEMQCPACEGQIGENYLTACEKENPAAGTPDAAALGALSRMLRDESAGPFQLEYRAGREQAQAWYQLMIFPLEGEEPGALLMQIDVTERRRAQDELQRQHEEIRSLARRLIHAQEEERRRIARELHDDICQRLAIHALQINSLRRNPTKNRAALAKRLDRLEKDAVEIGNALRCFSRELHSTVLEKFGLVAAIRDFCTRTAAQCGLELALELDAESLSVAPSLAISLYRIVQESFANVAKHAKASRVRVTLTADRAGVSLQIEDNGVGFQVDEVPRNLGFGLVSMKERVRSFSGTFSVDSAPGRGTRVTVEIPLNFNPPQS